MSGQEGSKTDLGLAFGALISKLYAVLELFDSKVASGQQNPQAVRAVSLMIAKAFAVYGMLKFAYFSVPTLTCGNTLMEAIEHLERSLNAMNDYLTQEPPDMAKAGEELEIMGTNETAFFFSLRTCLEGKQGKQV